MRQEVNLYPPELRNEGDWPSARVVVAVAGLLALLMAGVLALHTWQLFVAEAEIGAKRTKRGELQQRIDEFSGRIMPAESDADFEAKVREIESRIAKRDRLRRVLKGDVAGGSGGGYSEQFIGLARQAVPGVWLTHLSIRGAQALSLRGRAFDAGQIPHYLERLAQEPVFAGIQINALRLEKPEAVAAPEWDAAPAACCEFTVEAGGS